MLQFDNVEITESLSVKTIDALTDVFLSEHIQNIYDFIKNQFDYLAFCNLRYHSTTLTVELTKTIDCVSVKFKECKCSICVKLVIENDGVIQCNVTINLDTKGDLPVLSEFIDVMFNMIRQYQCDGKFYLANIFIQRNSLDIEYEKMILIKMIVNKINECKCETQFFKGIYFIQ